MRTKDTREEINIIFALKKRITDLYHITAQKWIQTHYYCFTFHVFITDNEIYFPRYNANKQRNIYLPYCFCNVTKCVHCSSSYCLFVSFKQLQKLKTYTHPLSSRYIFWTSVSNTTNQIYTVLLDLNKKSVSNTQNQQMVQSPWQLWSGLFICSCQGAMGVERPQVGALKTLCRHMNRLKCLFQKQGIWPTHKLVLICKMSSKRKYIQLVCSYSHNYNGRNWQDSRQ